MTIRDYQRLVQRTRALFPGAEVGYSIRLVGRINRAAFARLARVLESSEGPITLTIASEGGDVDMAMAMHEALRIQRDRAGRRITTIGVGSVMSAAVLLLAMGSRRYVTQGTKIMVHGSKLKADGPVAHVATQARALQEHDHEVDTLIAKYCGCTVAEYRALYRDGDCWLDANEAKTLGLVHEVL